MEEHATSVAKSENVLIQAGKCAVTVLPQFGGKIASISPALDGPDDQEVPQAVSEVLVARGGRLLGSILIADGIRPNRVGAPTTTAS